MDEAAVAYDNTVAVLHSVHDCLQMLYAAGDGLVHDPSVHVGIVLQ